MVDEVGRGYVARGAALVTHLSKWTVKDLLAAPGRVWRGGTQQAIPVQEWIGKEVEFVHIENQAVEHHRIGLGAVELVNDHVAHELPQRRKPAVATVGRGETDPPKIRNVQRVTELLDELHDTTASIYFVPDVFVFDLIQCRTTDIDGLPIVALCETPFFGARGITKRVSDFIIALLILILMSPLLLAIVIAIKATSPGSVIFRQRRYGLDGREIVVYKFRSMTVSEDSETVRQATLGDERITPIGAILRKYSLDELPQFVNVLQGRMSVVGPRPHAVAHNEEYRHLIKGYMVRHKVTPGITGLAQVRGFRGETSNLDAMRARVECDLEYLRNWSLSLDIKIILKTVVMMFRDKAAY